MTTVSDRAHARDLAELDQDRVKPIVLPTMSEEEWQEARARTDQEWARVRLQPGSGWRVRHVPPGSPVYGIRAAERGKTSLVFSCAKHDGRWWLHVSIAHPDKMPTYMDLAEVKRIFIGVDLQAIQIFPRAKEHINIHHRALHLWACLEPEGDGLPHFGEHGTI